MDDDTLAGKRLSEKEIRAWRLSIEHAQPVPLGAFNWPFVLGRVLDEIDAARAEVAALRSALERTEANFVAAVNGKPVRDMCENLAENRAALAAVPDPEQGETR